MNKLLIIFAAQCCLLIAGCHSVGNVIESPNSEAVKQTQNADSAVFAFNANAKIVREAAPTPTTERRVAKADMVRTGLYHNDKPRLGEHYKPFWIEGEQSDNGFEPFCVQTKVKGKRIERCGYQDAKGKVLLKPIFARAYIFSEGLAGVCPEIEQLCGYINEKGQLIVKANYQGVGVFSEGLGMVAIGAADASDYEKNGYIDKEGKFVINPQYTDGEPFKNGIARVKLRNLNLCINKKDEKVECHQ